MGIREQSTSDGRERLGFTHPAFRWIIGIYQVSAPAIDVYLDTCPADVGHAAPEINLAVAVAVVSKAFHRREIIIVIPTRVGIVYLVLVEHVSVIVQRESAVILGQRVLATIAAEKILVLPGVEIRDGRAIEIGGNVRTEVERVTLLRPDGEPVAAPLKDIGRRADLHRTEGLFFDVLRTFGFGCVKDAYVGVRGVELIEHLLHHRWKPAYARILIDERDGVARACGRSWKRAAASERSARGGEARSTQKLPARK